MNTDNLRSFLQGDGIWILTAIAVLLAIKAWRNSSWLQLFSVVGFYAVIVSIAKDRISSKHLAGSCASLELRQDFNHERRKTL